jgi:hypothetical protein
VIVTAQAVLTEIVRGTAQLAALADAVGGRSKDVVMAVQRLKRRGFVTSARSGEYAATDAGREFLAQGRQIQGGQDSPRPRTRTRGLRQRAWWVIRARKTVSVPDLLSVLSDGSERAAGSNLQKYLRVLVRAGYMAEHAQVLRFGPPRYRLVRDTGRLAPVFRQRQAAVFDPNTGEVIALDVGAPS